MEKLSSISKQAENKTESEILMIQNSPYTMMSKEEVALMPEKQETELDWVVQDIQNVLYETLWVDFPENKVIDAIKQSLSNNNLNTYKVTNLLIQSSNKEIYSKYQKNRIEDPEYHEYKSILDTCFEKAKESTKAVNQWRLRQVITVFNIIFLQVLNEKLDRNEFLNDDEIKKLKEEYFYAYPHAHKKLKHAYSSNKQKKELLERIQNEMEDIFFEASEEIFFEEDDPNSDRVILNDEETAIIKHQQFIYDYLENYKSKISPIRDYIIAWDFIQSEQENQRKNNKEKDKQANKKEWSWSKIFNTSITNHEEHLQKDKKTKKLITNSVNTLTVSEEEQSDLEKIIYRLYKKNKPFKKEDFFWENPKRMRIPDKDEKTILELLEKIGIKVIDIIVQIPSKGNKENINDEKEILRGEISTNQYSGMESTETPDNETIIKSLESLYDLENKEQLLKELNSFREKKGIHGASVLKKMTRIDLLQQTVSKWWWVFTVELGGQERLVLKKREDRLCIVNFFYDHNKYENQLHQEKY